MSETRQMACCPVCDRKFPNKEIEEHVNRCIFLNTKQESLKRPVSCLNSLSPQEKKTKLTDSKVASKKNNVITTPQEKPVELPVKLPELRVQRKSQTQLSSNESDVILSVPLAEQMRPTTLEQYIGQQHVIGHDKLLCSLLQKKDIPSMILWGPPGCGKTSLANIIASLCKKEAKFRFVKLSAAIAGIGDVKDVVKAAQNEMKFRRKTILFMDEIHRFNKLQQDVFLPHVENGTIILIGATTENPSFSLNTALLSRCRVIVLQKLTVENIFLILMKALEKQGNAIVIDPDHPKKVDNEQKARFLVEKSSLQWLADVSDGDARMALNSLQMALQARDPRESFSTSGPGILTLDDLKDGIKRSHILYDRKGEEHYNTISALHKSIRASDDNAALYWLVRMMEGGEDPMFIARRLIRTASEDIGLADPQALTLAVSCMQGCQQVGMPECDVLLAECAVYLARAPKSQEVYRALQACRGALVDHKGPLPCVPLHLRNATSELNSQLGYGKAYNTRHKDESNLGYLPQGLKKLDYFSGH